jgi:hypothetical protein
MAETINVKIAEIVIPERWRKKETDVTGLANSILELDPKTAALAAERIKRVRKEQC